MKLEEQLRTTLTTTLSRVDAAPGDLEGARTQGRRIRRRRASILVAVASVASVAFAGGVLAATRSPDGTGVDPAGGRGTWQQVTSAPITPRWNALSGWTGTEALFIGGGVSTPCPPNADCVDPDTFARDGAAYDPARGTWRTIAPAPVPMPYYFRTTMVGDTFVVFGDGAWFAYDAGADRWATLPDPPVRVPDPGLLTSHDGKVYAMTAAGRVQVLDVTGKKWSQLPLDRLGPLLEPGTVIATDLGVAVTVWDRAVAVDGDAPAFVMVHLWDGQSWRSVPQTGQIGAFTHWTGQRLVSGDLQVATGLDGNPPFGGRLDLISGEWSALPDAPDPERDTPRGWSLNASDGPLIAGWGYVYDDDAETWTVIGKPVSEVDASQSSVWADGTLVTFGGLDTATGYEELSGLSNEAWIWTP